MKNLIISALTIVIINLNAIAQNYSPYIKVGESSKSIQQISDEVTAALNNASFTVLGQYNPEGKSNLKVIVFTYNELKNTVVKVADRGALAAAYKIGLVANNGKVTVSYTNPDYILRAYLGDNFNKYKTVFDKFSNDVKTALMPVGNEFKPFGGSVDAEKLGKYHYKIMMPYFTDPVELNEYSSFDEGLKLIEKNLKAKKGQTFEVYKIVYPDKKVAVFGVALQNKENGEAAFLPIIGEAHIAAMPYEIILQGNTVTMLHGKYRIALHWPELTMGTFMNIMSTPGDIEDTLELLCE
ncbi:hypothetical protein EC396_15920 [Lutibacter sp. HS1-25]|uniref:hypothetical protein n=1 Tax=Lutibacter sp. HS1-25 TaxID=2485000 RepID=UPI001011A6CB|nr:hypothetical protein [Lutibacter sp. HS1-25]RXP45178.1 hypothetical protein EC396_15920 [Lutibacter sp. HS1-25]